MELQWKLPAILCLSICSVLAATPAIAADADTDQRIQAVEQGLIPAVRIKGRTRAMTLSSRMAHYKVPGVSIAVIEDNGLAWARGYGLRQAEDGDPVDEHTLFQAASISKPIAAVGALKLVESGAVTLEGNVNAWLKSWNLPENEFTQQHPVTLEKLLSHTAGTTVHGFGGYRIDADLPTIPQILDGQSPANSSAVRVDKLPGEGFRYSGGGTTIAQLLVQDVSGRPFAEYMQAEVLTPLGMIDSTYEHPLPTDRHAQAARGHLSSGRILEGGWHVYPERAAAGLWTTPSDLARYAIEVQLAYQGRSRKVLSPAMIRNMLTPRGRAGLGPMISVGEEVTRFSHGGSNHGYKCQFVADLNRGQGAAVMTNGDQGGALAREILNAVADVYDWPDYLPDERSVADVEESVLEQYVGRYVMKQFGTVVLKMDDGYLSATSLFGPRFNLFFESETEFFTDLPGLEGRFVVNEEDPVELVVQLRDRELRGKRR